MNENMIQQNNYAVGTVGHAVKKETSLTTPELAELFGVRVQLLDRIFRGDHPITRTVIQGLTNVTKRKAGYWKKIDFQYWGI